MRLSSYSDHLANFWNILASINRGGLSKFSTLFSCSLTPLFLTLLFFYFLSYIKDVLEALTLGISFLYAKYFRFQRELNKFLWTLKYSFTKKSTLMQEVVFLFFFYSFLLILLDDAWIRCRMFLLFLISDVVAMCCSNLS